MSFGQRETALQTDLSYAPTIGQSTKAAFQKPFEQVNQLGDYIFPGRSTEKERRASADRLSGINEILEDPRQGYTQKGLNFVSGMIGDIIPTIPLFAAGGAIGGGIASAVGFAARETVLELGTEGAISTYLGTQVPLSKLATGPLSHLLPNASIGGIAGGLVKAYGGYKGVTIPEHFAEHYNAIENSLDTSHAIQDWASDNYGFLLGAAPLAAGYIAFKGLRGIVGHRNAKATKVQIDAELARLHAEHKEVLKHNEIKEGIAQEKEAKYSELQDHLQHAEEMGLISPEHHQWYLDYLENPNDMDKVHIGGLKVLQSLQIPYDRVTGRVWNQVMGNEGVRNLKGALFDQEITSMSEEERQLMSSYVVHNELDAYIGTMRDNPNLLMAIKGMTHNIEIKIAEHSLAMKNFDYALTNELPKGLLKRQIFSQNNIYQHLKKIGVHGIRDVPYTVPKDVAYMLKLEKQIKDIKSKQTKKQKLQYENGEHLVLKNKIKELKKGLMHPAQELQHLRDALMPEGKLISDFKNRKSYHRLEELSQVWPEAKTVLDRIHMGAINAKQKGLNTILQKFTEMVDNTSARLADPDAVKRYLHTRMENSVPFIREYERAGINIEARTAEINKLINESKPKTNNEHTETIEKLKEPTLFDDESQNKVNNTELQHAKEYYDSSKSKWRQFSENTKALDELIKCALGE